MLVTYKNIVRQLAGAVLVIGGTLVLGAGPSRAALTVQASTDAAAMAAALIGPGIKLVPGSATYIGATIPQYPYNDASGFFFGDTSIFGNPAGASGVLLTSGSVLNALPPNDKPDPPQYPDGATQNNQFQGSAYLNTLVPGIDTRDASTLTFKITLDPGIAGVQWTYAFGSEEYLQFVGREFNDIFALSLDGTNLALIPSTSVPVAINNVNPGNNAQYYRDNPVNSNNYATQYNGLTTVLTSTATGLTPGV